MTNLPQGWLEVEIGEISKVIGGGTPTASDESNFAEPGTAIAWLTPADLSGYKAKEITHGKRDLSQKGLKGSSATLMPKGSLLFSSRAPIGYVAIAKNEIATNQGFKSFVFTNHIDPSFAYFYLKSIRSLAESRGTGTTFKELSGAAAKKLPFLIAPLNEQIRIANKLDSVLAKVDAAQARLEKIPTLLKRFRQAVLAAATSGELTKEWREVNSTLSFGHEDELAIKEIVDAQHAAACKKAEKLGRRKPRHPRANKKSIGVEITMPDIPKQWLYQRLEDITHLVSDGTHFTPKYVEEGIPFFSVKNVRPFKVSDEDIKHVSEEEYEEIDARCSSEFGDILYTKVGATYGYAAMNKLNYRHAIYVSLALIKPVKEYFLSEYAEIVMNSELVFGQARSRVSGMGVPDLHLIEIRDFKIPIPHVLEQKEIVRRVESLFALADVVEKQYFAAKKRTDRLPQSLLAKAFRGELVPQDPNDEPAAELLKRIQAERLAQPPVKNKRAKSA